VTARRFPAPWTACFVVRDHNGQQLAYVYFEDEPGRRLAAKLLSKDEAQRIAVNLSKAWANISRQSEPSDKPSAVPNRW
jgi:hypothetical protein